MKKSLFETIQKSIQGQLSDEKYIRDFYSVDASSYKITPKIVITPKNDRDVISIVKIAKKFKVSVTVRGAGTGLVGSALNTGIILDMKNFDSCTVKNDHVKVGPGTIKGKLDKSLEDKAKFFPPNPSIGAYCSIGGMLGNNSSGSRSLKYGSMIDNVLEITFVDGNGKKITLPEDKKISKKILGTIEKQDLEKFPKVSKNSSGYRTDKIMSEEDSHKLLVGSEGTLGIVLSAKLKIKDKPKRRILFVIEYNSVNKAAKNCLDIIKTNPSAIEFVDKTTINQINFKFGNKTNCALFVEYDEKIFPSEKKLKQITKGKIVQRLTKESDINKGWKYRDASLHYSLKSIKKEKKIPHVIEDSAVPLEKLPNLFSTLNKLNKKFKTSSIAYGHAGNGNIHIRLIANQAKKETIKKIASQYFDEIIKLGGTITAEHGDGLARSEFIKRQYGKENYEIFKKIKQIFDPYSLLNPGKIITNSSTIVKNLEKF